MKSDYPSEAAFDEAARRIGCEVAVIKAFARTEAGNEGAFLDTGEPTILFEPHIFSRLTGHKYDGYRIPGVVADWGIISRRAWAPGTYGRVSQQHWRLANAAKLDRDAALQSASWGLFQIMGMNYRVAGFDGIQPFVNAMYRDADAHLDAFVDVILNMHPQLAPALRVRDWPVAARIYNGKEYKKNRYDVRMAWNYRDIVAAA